MDAPLPVALSLCCGIDVRKKALTACLLKPGASGGTAKHIRAFKTVTGALQELAAWLVGEGCRHVACCGGVSCRRRRSGSCAT
jgi:transposase